MACPGLGMEQGPLRKPCPRLAGGDALGRQC